MPYGAVRHTTETETRMTIPTALPHAYVFTALYYLLYCFTALLVHTCTARVEPAPPLCRITCFTALLLYILVLLGSVEPAPPLCRILIGAVIREHNAAIHLGLQRLALALERLVLVAEALL
jgi:hypothetical protein